MLRLAHILVSSLLLAAPLTAGTNSDKGSALVESKKAKKAKKTKATEQAFTSSAIQPYKSEPAAATSGSATSGGAMIMAYKRDPVPVFDEAGSKLRDVAKAAMPKANTAAARVLGAKPGFVAIMLDGSRAWLRLTAVDYVGNLATPPCEKVVTSFAKMEEDGVERSLGLGCKNN